MSQELDTFGYTSENNPNAKKILKDGLANLGMVDIFREIFPNKKRYSWRQFGGNKKARLDNFFISATLLPFISKVDILPGILSDHSIQIMEVDFSKFKRGRGFFKFNTSLLKELDYVTLINETIRDTAAKYTEDIYNDEFLKTATPEQMQELIYTISPQLLLETLLLEIRGKTIML